MNLPLQRGNNRGQQYFLWHGSKVVGLDLGGLKAPELSECTDEGTIIPIWDDQSDVWSHLISVVRCGHRELYVRFPTHLSGITGDIFRLGVFMGFHMDTCRYVVLATTVQCVLRTLEPIPICALSRQVHD